MLKRFIIILLLSASKFSFATKQSLLDSLQHVIDTTTNLRLKTESLYTLSYEYGLIEPELGIQYGRACYRLAAQEHDYVSQLNAYNGIGNAYETLGNYDSALHYHQRSFEIAQLHGSPYNLVATSFNVANCYKELGDYHTALDIYLKAFSVIENGKKYNPRVHYYLSELYLKLNQIKEAQFHALEGLKRTLNTDYDYIGYNHAVLLAKCLYQEGDTDSALIILHETLDSLKTNTDQFSIALCLNAIGEIYLDLSEYKKALDYFREEYFIQEQTRNKNGLALVSLNLAYCYAQLNDAARARNYLRQTINNLDAIKRNKDILMKALYKIALVSEEAGDYPQAVKYYKAHFSLKDSLMGIENLHQINELQTIYATEKKERKIELQQIELENQHLLLSRRKSQFIALILIFLLLLLTGLFFYYRYRSRQKLKFVSEVQRLENIRDLALKDKENEERMRIARNIHDELGSGISKIFLLAEGTLPLLYENPKAAENIKTLSRTAKSISENMRDLVWTLDPDNNTLDNLIAKMHEYSSDFFEDLPVQLHYQIPDNFPPLKISKEAMRNIFLVYKESLNNIIKHARATETLIQVSFEKQLLKIIIQDNGRGFNPDLVRKTSNGLKNMMNRMKDSGGELGIESNDTGTTVTIICPIPKDA